MTSKIFNAISLDGTESEGSYAIGLQIGQQLLESKLPVNAEAVAKGIFDMLNNNPPAIDLTIASKALEQMQKKQADVLQMEFEEIKQEGAAYLAENKQKQGVQETASGLQYEILSEGSGIKPSTTDKVRVHYTGNLIDGTIFDSSVKRGAPAEFPVNGVIRGWTEALSMMPVGSKWRLTIPYSLAYGERGAGGMIKPFSTLIFEVELLDIV